MPIQHGARRKMSWVWVLAGLVALTFVGAMLMASGSGSVDTVGSRVAIVSLQGAIAESGSRSLLGGSSGGSRRFLADLDLAIRDPLAKAVVIRINSPGGSASASQEMYEAVMRARAKKKVFASMGDVAASGGYYIASACDKIYANRSTLTGSIGVISQYLNYSTLFRKVGLDQAIIKSGKFKDAGNPSRPLTAEEKALFQAMIRDIYGQFVDDIVAGRKAATGGKLTKARLLPLADGRVFTGRQAKSAGLVDELGGLYETVQAAGKAVGIEGEVRSADIEQPSLFGGLFGVSADTVADHVAAQAGESFGRSFGAAVADEMKARLQSSSPAPHL